MDPSGSRGYGPSMQGGKSHLMFDGEESNYEQWEVKLLAYLSLRKLKKTVLGEERQHDHYSKNRHSKK